MSLVALPLLMANLVAGPAHAAPLAPAVAPAAAAAPAVPAPAAAKPEKTPAPATKKERHTKAAAAAPAATPTTAPPATHAAGTASATTSAAPLPVAPAAPIPVAGAAAVPPVTALPAPHSPITAAPPAVGVAGPAAPVAPPVVLPPAAPAPAPEAIPPELLIPPAGAPAAAAANSGAPAGEYFDPNQVDVVKVTVDRREQNLQNYAGSASAFTEEDLTRVGVTSVREMAQTSPSLEIGTQEGNTEIFIRGVGSTNNTELGDPSAATHVDGIYIPRPRGVGSMFFDLERVELNRGPQGTIRGRNATAGSLNIITAKPRLGYFGAEGSIQLGNYSQRLTRAMVNIPLGETLALRFASFSENHDSFYSNGGPISTITPAENADNLAYRASAKWAPLSNLTVNIGHDFTQEKGTGYTGANFDPALRAGLLPNEVPDPRRVVYRGPQPGQNLRHWGLTADVLANLGPVQINYLGGYRNLRYRQVTGGNLGVAFPGQEITNSSLDNWSTSWWYSASQSQVHEVRVMAPDNARLRWTLGGFVFHEKQQVTLFNTADNSNTFAGVEYTMPYVRGNSQAGYLDAIFDITSRLRATGGYRFTHETKDRTGIGAVWLVDNANPGGQNFRFGTEGFQPAFENRTMFPVQGQAFDANSMFLNGVGQFGARDTLGQAIAGGATVQAGPISAQNGHYSGNFNDFRLGLDFDVRPASLLYGTFTTGHTSGGFNDNINYTDAKTGMAYNTAPTYKPESLYAFEVGSKNEMLDRRVRINAAAFLYLYRDQVFQVIQQTGPAPMDVNQPPPSSAVRVNVGRSHILGLEFDGSYKLPLGFIVGLSGLLMDARFDEGQLFDNRVAYGPTNSATDRVDIKGKHLPRAPLATLNYSLSQNFRTGIGWFDWIASAQTRSEYYMTVFNGRGVDSLGNTNPGLSDVVPSYTRIDLGVGYTRPDGKVRISAFGNNVNNVAYMTTFINQPGLNLRYFNTPRQVGVRLNLYW